MEDNDHQGRQNDHTQSETVPRFSLVNQQRAAEAHRIVQADSVNDERNCHQETAPHDFVKAYDVIQVALKEFVHGKK